MRTGSGEMGTHAVERNQRNYSLISVTYIGTNDGTTVELNGTRGQDGFEIGSARFRCGSVG